MQTKNKTQKRFIRNKNGVCYILNTNYLDRTKQLKMERDVQEGLCYGWKKSHDNLMVEFEKNAETLNRLSKEYNDLVGENKHTKEQNSWLESEKNRYMDMAAERYKIIGRIEYDLQASTDKCKAEEKHNEILKKSKAEAMEKVETLISENKKCWFSIKALTVLVCILICLIAYLLK